MKAPGTARIPYLDGLRGVAAAMVALMHIFCERASYVFPATVAETIQRGNLGVQLFFVVSGFVIARALSAAPLTGATARQFLVKRIVRLDPPYWASIALMIAAIAVSNQLLPDRHAPFPSPLLVAAHLVYVQDLLGLPPISEIYWTLCFEIQFYLLLMLTFVARQRLLRRIERVAFVDAITFGLPAIYSLLVLAGALPSPRGSSFGSWCLFLAGVLAERYCSGQLRAAALSLFLGALVVIAAARADLRPLVAAATAASIAIGHRRDLLGRWLAGPRVQYLGKISYSLYLVHPLVGQRLANLGFRLTGASATWALIWGALGFAAAIGAAHLFWRWIEVPSLALSRTLGGGQQRQPGPSPEPMLSR